LETRSDFQSAEVWAKIYRPIKQRNRVDKRVGGTLFDASGVDGAFVARMDKEFVWSVFNAGFFDYVQNGLAEDAVGYLVSDNPVLFKDLNIKFAIGYDDIDWGDFDQFQEAMVTVDDNYSAAQLDDDIESVDASVEAPVDPDGCEPGIEPVVEEPEIVAVEGGSTNFESLPVEPVRAREQPAPEAAALDQVTHYDAEARGLDTLDAAHAYTAEIAGNSADPVVVDDQVALASPYLPGVDGCDPFAESDPGADCREEVVLVDVAGDIQSVATQQIELEIAHAPEQPATEALSVPEDTICEPDRAQVYDLDANAEPVHECDEPEHLPDDESAEPFSLDTSSFAPAEPDAEVEEVSVASAVCEQEAEAVDEEPDLSADREPDPLATPDPLIMRELPVGWEAAQIDFETYGAWPNSVLCQSCQGTGFFAGIRISEIGCPLCDERGWKPPEGTPHEIPVTV